MSFPRGVALLSLLAVSILGMLWLFLDTHGTDGQVDREQGRFDQDALLTLGVNEDHVVVLG